MANSGATFDLNWRKLYHQFVLHKYIANICLYTLIHIRSDGTDWPLVWPSALVIWAIIKIWQELKWKTIANDGKVQTKTIKEAQKHCKAILWYCDCLTCTEPQKQKTRGNGTGNKVNVLEMSYWCRLKCKRAIVANTFQFVLS